MDVVVPVPVVVVDAAEIVKVTALLDAQKLVVDVLDVAVVEVHVLEDVADVKIIVVLDVSQVVQLLVKLDALDVVDVGKFALVDAKELVQEDALDVQRDAEVHALAFVKIVVQQDVVDVLLDVVDVILDVQDALAIVEVIVLLLAAQDAQAVVVAAVDVVAHVLLAQELVVVDAMFLVV